MKRLMIFVGMIVLSSMVLVKLQPSEAAPNAGDCALPGCTQRFVVAPNGVTLAVKEFGNPGSPTIMLIHGFSQSHLSWNRQFEDLVEKGFRVVAWDYPGHGDSDKPTDVSFYAQPQVWGDYVQAVIDDLAVDKVCLVGHSQGGMVIDDYIFIKGTGNVAGVVYDGGAHRFDGIPGATPEFFDTAFRLVDPELSVRLQATMDFIDMLTDQGLPSEEVTNIAMYNMHVIREAIWGLIVYAGWEKSLEYDGTVLDGLASVPVLFIHGDKDAILPLGNSEVSLDLIQQAAAGGADVELITLDGVGHSPQFEVRNKFNDDVAEFCGSHLGN